MKRLIYILLFGLILTNITGYSQVTSNDLIGSENAIEYAVPFLIIAPDSRAGAMGDAGVATSPDYNSMHWNAAKYAFIESDLGISVSYTPWLRNLIGDIDLAYVSAFKRIDQRQTVAATLLYFSLGEIQFTNDIGELLNVHKPNEFSVDVAYARSFSDNISGGIAFRYIRSDITGGAYAGSTETKAGNAVAADVSMYYVNDRIKLAQKNSTLSFGLNISNIGSKLSYTDIEKDFLPTNLKLGLAYLINIDDFNSLTLAIDLNKFLVPTPPDYDSLNVIVAGYDPDVSVPQGMIQSFYDAPGGFSEEMHEIKYSIGAEYWYAKQFAVRGGYFTENENKGNRKYFTAGVGLKFNVFTFDFSYLISTQQNHPLDKTMRFTLGLDFQALRNQKRQKAS
ncbi:MAG: hypothetical protein A2X13_10455 [Bacteroidetes bacterium GWC2_33_15]|nr:MAG: hypothetical protein A2X10_03005 [Bacteroidetes bacterium GWA2_33_15]OFX48820.1 MAG: hypothetical protein A2X13_10455 [Bacteroidetes bacterium GWC2_33_15]OFX66063.1 MAG: hypothetical protein A2X15_11600 [Bacteroidetes bacterium GWB2_32_14]OFX68175.1 MAG: hypothetical protein A2X14_07295 [Bacteroidetes bacterium GWD2_33_33]HAN17949.1 hypothetical protein [Bacteroidales bacterium]